MLEREHVVNVVSEAQTAEAGNSPNYHSQIFRQPRRTAATLGDLKDALTGVILNHRKFFSLVANTGAVLLATVLLTELLSSACVLDDNVFIADASVFCDPYYPLDRVVVDIDLNTTSHCYSSKSCAALGQRLKEEQGKFRYNFIVGAFGFTYMQAGFTCQSEALEDALYIRLPVDSIYNGHDFMAARKAVGKFSEVLREGLECGKIHKNYTVTATGCGRYNDWCTKMLYQLLAEDSTERGASGPRVAYYDKIQPGGFYNPLNLNRVYSYQYKLVVCTKAPGK